MPRVRRGNKFILTNYRPRMSFVRLLMSAFSLHNETFNVWSHLLGSACMCSLLVWFVRQQPDEHAFPPKWPLVVYTISTIFLFTASWWAHLTGPLSRRYHNFVFKLDYLGIILTTVYHFLPISFYMFVDESLTVRVMYILVPSCMGIALTTLAVSNKFCNPSWVPIRALCFTVYGSSTIVPLIHGSIKYWNDDRDFPRLGLMCLASDIVLNGLGALLYGKRLPERKYPRTFDVIGNSHNIMHVLSVGGLVSFFFCAYCFWEGGSTPFDPRLM